MKHAWNVARQHVNALGDLQFDEFDDFVLPRQLDQWLSNSVSFLRFRKGTRFHTAIGIDFHR